MKRTFLFLLAIAVLGFSCGNESLPPAPTLPRGRPPIVTAVDASCASDNFFYGRPVGLNDLRSWDLTHYTLESVEYRDVLSRSANDVELAYRVRMVMERDPRNRALVPIATFACREVNHPSLRALRISRTTIPVLNDLHLPSSSITVFDPEQDGRGDRDRLNNFPRMNDFSVSSDGYFAFPANPASFRGSLLVEYLDHLRYRSLYPRVELREMGYGRIGIYAEKDYAGERSQLLIVLVSRELLGVRR